MIILLSPAKTLNFETAPVHNKCSVPEFISFSKDLISGLSKLKSREISELMGISPKLAELNYSRFQAWEATHHEKNSKQAILAFRGDVYEGLQAWNFSKSEFSFAQKNLRILSGLYGILRPLDLIQPHRLEMGTKLRNPAGKNLYSFWGDSLAKSIKQDLKNSRSKLLVNLASQEYFKAAQEKIIDTTVISPVFKDEKNGEFKIISFYAKKARGYMSSFLIRNRIENLEGLQNFADHGYRLCPDQSTTLQPVFLRSEENQIAA